MSLNVLIVTPVEGKLVGQHICSRIDGFGHETSLTWTEPVALERIGRKKYDVVMVDGGFDDENPESLEMARRLKQAAPESFVYLLMPGIDLPVEGPEGINAYFPKNMRWVDSVFGEWHDAELGIVSNPFMPPKAAPRK